MAAISIAERVAAERGEPVGESVGYSVRFLERVSKKTRIRYCTDGIAVREALDDRTFKNTDVFIVDEAHERSVQTDILLGLLKQALQTNKKLRVVIMSATMNTQTFADYFGTDRVLFLQGRMFPVRHFFTHEREQNYLEATCLTILQIHEQFARSRREKKNSGDILVFLPGEREINTVIATVQLLKPQSARLQMIPLFANLSQEDQMVIFSPKEDEDVQRCICATNIAETSLTVPNVVYVIDSGFVRQKVFDSKTSISKLLTIPASKSAILQRCGRAGRVCDGRAYHMYTQKDYDALRVSDVCEVLRCDLSEIYLTLIGCGVKDVLNFQFVNQPSGISKKLALSKLFDLGLISVDPETHEFGLSDLGHQVIQLPLVLEEALTILRAIQLRDE